MNAKQRRLVTSVTFAALLYCPSLALSQAEPPLGVVSQFSVLGNSGVTGSTGIFGTVVNGDVGSSPTATISNFPPSSVIAPFIVHFANDSTVVLAHTDAIAAYNFLAAQGPGTTLVAQLDGAVLTSGIYSFLGGAADLANNGTLTLNGGGIFIFEVASTLTANTGSNVIGTADPCNVFWRVGSSATLLGDSFRGSVIADASITVGDGSNVTGRVIAGIGETGAATMSGAGNNTIGGCASTPNGGTCTIGSDCTSGVCNGGICAPCTSASDCASGLCNGGICMPAQTPMPAPTLSPWALAALLLLLAGVAHVGLRRAQRERVQTRSDL